MRAEITLSTSVKTDHRLMSVNGVESTYTVYFTNTELFRKGEGIIAIDRDEIPVSTNGWKTTRHKVDVNEVFICDEKRVTPLQGEVLKTSPQSKTCPAEIKMGISDRGEVMFTIRVLDVSEPVVRRCGRMNPYDVVTAAAPDFDPRRRGMKVTRMDELNEEQIENGILPEFSLKESTPKFMGMRITSCRLEDVPLISADKYVAKEWMRILRLRNWRSSLITPEQMRSDQARWAEMVSGDRRFVDYLVLSGDDLLNDVRSDYEIYWNIATVYDLGVGLSPVSTGFSLSENTSVLNQFKRYVFTDDVCKRLDSVYVVDSYVYCDFPEIMSRLVPENVRVRFLLGRNKYERIKEQYLEYMASGSYKFTPRSPIDEKDLKPNMSLMVREITNKDNHSRFLALKMKDGTWKFWELDNSLDKLKVFETGDVGCIVEKINVDVRGERHFTRSIVDMIKEDSDERDNS